MEQSYSNSRHSRLHTQNFDVNISVYINDIALLRTSICRERCYASSIDIPHDMPPVHLVLQTEGLMSQLESAHVSEKELQERLEAVEKQFAEYREEHESVTEQKSIMASEDYLLLQTQVTDLQENVVSTLYLT